MLPEITMPWWAGLYLLVALIVFAMSWSVDAARTHNNVVASSLSLFTICVSVLGFFNQEIAGFLGLMIIPMVAIGIYWEYTRSMRETVLAQNMLDEDPELSDQEKETLLNVAMIFNGLIIVPGYVTGLILCFNALSNLF